MGGKASRFKISSPQPPYVHNDWFWALLNWPLAFVIVWTLKRKCPSLCLSQIPKCISRRHSHPDIGRLVSLRRLCIVRRKSKDWGPSCFWSVSLRQYFPCQLYIKADGTVLYSSSTKCLDLGPKSLPHPSFRTLQSRAQVLSSPSTQIAPILRVSACGKSSWLALRWDDLF